MSKDNGLEPTGRWSRTPAQLPSEIQQQRSIIEATGLTIDDLAKRYQLGLDVVTEIAKDKGALDKDRLSAAKRLMDLPHDMPGHGNQKGKVTNQTIIVQSSPFDSPSIPDSQDTEDEEPSDHH